MPQKFTVEKAVDTLGKCCVNSPKGCEKVRNSPHGCAIDKNLEVFGCFLGIAVTLNLFAKRYSRCQDSQVDDF